MDHIAELLSEGLLSVRSKIHEARVKMKNRAEELMEDEGGVPLSDADFVEAVMSSDVMEKVRTAMDGIVQDLKRRRRRINMRLENDDPHSWEADRSNPQTVVRF